MPKRHPLTFITIPRRLFAASKGEDKLWIAVAVLSSAEIAAFVAAKLRERKRLGTQRIKLVVSVGKKRQLIGARLYPAYIEMRQVLVPVPGAPQYTYKEVYHKPQYTYKEVYHNARLGLPHIQL